MRFFVRRFYSSLTIGLILILFATAVQAQLKIDFTREPDDEPLQEDWEPFQGDGIDILTENFELGGKSIDVSVEGYTHWRDYRPATMGFEPISDLVRDGVLCNAACLMVVTLENLADGKYDIRTYLHTTQFGPQDGRPFTPISISLTDGAVSNKIINNEALMSDDSSLDLSTETIPFTVVGGSAVEIALEKFEGTDHMQLAGIELGARGSLGDPPVIIKPPPPEPIGLPTGELMIDFSREPDEFPLQEDWQGFVGEGTDVFTEELEFEGGTVEVTLEGNTHWRDYRPATGIFEEFSDLLSDGPLCNAACLMTVTLDGLPDGEYDVTAVMHTTQFGAQDGRPFTPFEIRYSDAANDDEVINDEAFMSDDSSEDISTQTIPVVVTGGSAVSVSFEKFEGQDHFALPGLIVSSAGILGDFNSNGVLDSDDVDQLTADARAGTNTPKFDLSGDGNVDNADQRIWVKDLSNTWFGDANLDGEFNSSDFVAVFQEGKFEKDEPATWAQGDWNGDGRFSSGDFVVAFQDGGFELGPRVASVPEPVGVTMLMGVLLLIPGCRFFRRH